MNSTPVAAFGHVVFMCDSPAGSSLTTPLGADGKYQIGLYFFTRGLAKLSVVETGEPLGDRAPGWLNLEHNAPASGAGTLRVDYPEDTAWVCIPMVTNEAGLPNLESMHVLDGGNAQLVVGSNIFLALGSLIIGGKTFTAPAQIRVRSGDVTATAVGEVRALRFL